MLGTAPVSTSADPCRARPAITEARLLNVSAITPVGTSKRKIVPSITVPTITSSNGFRRNVWT